MNKQKSLKLKRNNCWLWMGVAGVLLTIIPCIILGEDSIFTYTDQLDGEMIAYILQAKHLFQGSGIAEFMNGASKTALTLPAPLWVFLFLPGNYCKALIFMGLIGKLCGYIGMYLLVRDVAEENWIAALFGLLYSCLPFLAVYGLAEYGLPLLFWCTLQIKKGRCLPGAYCYIILYGLSSSLVLVGFGVLGMGLVSIAWQLLQMKRGEIPDKKTIRHLIIAWVLLLLVYIGENWRLLGQLLGGGESFVSHKVEYVSKVSPFWQVFRDSLISGGQHSQGYHLLLLAYTVFFIGLGCLGLWHRRSDTDREFWTKIEHLLRVIGFCFGWNLFFALMAGIWKSELGLELRSRLSLLGTIQMDRVLWIAPCLWYLAAACGLGVIYRFCRRNVKYVFGLLPMLVLSAATMFWMLYSSDFKANIQKLENPGYYMISYRDYYAIGVMEQVKDYLDAYTQKTMDEYRVVSLGIDPAAALYHGFYCLDGYSNNYSLDYKKKFREIIAPELGRSDYLEQYFDEWGNRCYLFSSECPGYYTIEKNGFYFKDYQIDTGALYELGGRFLLSAAYIQNAQEQGLLLLNETPFETPDSYYRIFVYEVKERHME